MCVCLMAESSRFKIHDPDQTRREAGLFPCCVPAGESFSTCFNRTTSHVSTLSDAPAPFFTQHVHFHSQATRTLPRFAPVFGRPLFIHSLLLNAIAEVRSLSTRHKKSAGVLPTSSGHSRQSAFPDMYGASGIPELIPPSGPPRQPGPAGQYNPGHPQVNQALPNPQRLGQRAPKLGQIGRSKKGEGQVGFLMDVSEVHARGL